MEFLDLLKKRHSVKAFNDQKVSKKDLDKIVEAGLYSPSGMNKQAVKFLVVTDKKLIDRIGKINASIMGVDKDPFYNAQALIVVFGNKNASTYVEDASLALGNMLNEAFSIGVDSCWVHRAKETFLTEEGLTIKKTYGIEDDYIGVGNCILGFRAKEFGVKPRVANRVIYVEE